jgi:hypothetical protein
VAQAIRAEQDDCSPLSEAFMRNKSKKTGTGRVIRETSTNVVLTGTFNEGDGRQVFCPDIVGRGKSDWLSNSSDYNYAQYLTDMTTLIARLIHRAPHRRSMALPPQEHINTPIEQAIHWL